mgnify:CR=1 FL=1
MNNEIINVIGSKLHGGSLGLAVVDVQPVWLKSAEVAAGVPLWAWIVVGSFAVGALLGVLGMVLLARKTDQERAVLWLSLRLGSRTTSRLLRKLANA